LFRTKFLQYPPAFDITFASPGHPDDTIGIIGMYHQFHRFLSALGYTQNTIRSVAAEATQDIELTT